ncbi:mannitol-1-phosphate 5-dehydrogenase [Salimicrobium halophilum]|uniref:Mannitol-1-phosphate 5-dehydrogenase n=1 Tax=Salimicrobium halophilum TaxID=86666 RepID=A0A1G8S3U3_9BACI|nr:mannitol-1-phosphate 5-dehydrogenase [Salimicrobium halophilum]SDJ23873.1 mannitol-1-phosphate 5-dehydrogenase [Salimicrobium halophilum]
MKAVHFGAGNIGRGFIGELLYKSGYSTTFVDVNAEIIEALNDEKEYTVHYAGSDEKLKVTRVRGIDSSKDSAAVTEAVQEADLVTTAVGPNVLPLIATAIAEGLKGRTGQEPLTIIACENMIGGSTLLKEEVSKLTEEEVLEKADFPDSAVDRIVPIQHNEKLLDVSVEPYFEWIVEEGDIRGGKPPVEGITYVDHLEPYIERKLFSVNTGHAATAYKGARKGYETIREAMDDETIVRHVRSTLKETGDVLVERYGFDRYDHEKYIDKIIERFKNPDLSDFVTRVGRGPIRKLGIEDRLVRPARAHLEIVGREPEYLVDTIIAALSYENPEDEEAVKLKALREERGPVGALKEITGLDDSEPLIQAVAKRI